MRYIRSVKVEKLPLVNETINDAAPANLHPRRDHFCQLLRKELGNAVEFHDPEGGMAAWVKFLLFISTPGRVQAHQCNDVIDCNVWLHVVVRLAAALRSYGIC